MKKMRFSVGKNNGVIFCVGTGMLVSLLLSAVLTIGMTSLIQNGKLSENGSIIVFFVRAIAVLIGGLFGAGLSKDKYLIVIFCIALSYMIVLLVLGIIMFDVSFNNLGAGVLSIAIGATVALLIKLKPQTTRKKALRYAK